MSFGSGGLSGMPLSWIFLRSAGDMQKTDEPIDMSSKFSKIGRRANEQVLTEKVAVTQKRIAAKGFELLHYCQPSSPQSQSSWHDRLLRTAQLFLLSQLSTTASVLDTFHFRVIPVSRNLE